MSKSANGHFGEFGGRYVPEILMPALEELEAAYNKSKEDVDFQKELSYYLENYAGRPTPLYKANRMSSHLGGATILLKREDLNFTGSHKLNNTLGQILLAKRMGKRRIIAETGAGQHGVATATVSALFGFHCVIYMGQEDMERQALNVFRMRLLGAEVRCVKSGTCTLKDATNEAIRDWVANIDTTHYIIGSVVGPHPYPRMVRDFQSIIGKETKAQLKKDYNIHPKAIIACIGGGSNAMGIFYPFIKDKSIELYGVEAAGAGLDSNKHAASIALGRTGVLHGAKSFLLQDDDGQILPTHSISAGLDYPGVGPEHSYLKISKRAKYESVTDKQALTAFFELSKFEGITPALESAHALAFAFELAPRYSSKDILVVNVSGRGDKDVSHVAKMIEKEGIDDEQNR